MRDAETMPALRPTLTASFLYVMLAALIPLMICSAIFSAPVADDARQCDHKLVAGPAPDAIIRSALFADDLGYDPLNLVAHFASVLRVETLNLSRSSADHGQRR